MLVYPIDRLQALTPRRVCFDVSTRYYYSTFRDGGVPDETSRPAQEAPPDPILALNGPRWRDKIKLDPAWHELFVDRTHTHLYLVPTYEKK